MVQDRAWVEDLCLADISHYHAMEVAMRNERLREQLHLMVSAAAVTADGGKAFQAMDKTLAPATTAGARPNGEAQVEAAPITDKTLAYAMASAAEAERMWG